MITESQVKTLCEAIEARGTLDFPLSSTALGAVAGTVFRAQKQKGEFKPSFRQRLLSKVNYSYASVASFLLWIGPKNVVIEPEFSEKTKKLFLRVTLIEGHSIDWNVLKESKFTSPLI